MSQPSVCLLHGLLSVVSHACIVTKRYVLRNF